MTESERKDYQRLKAAGRWSQASEFREAERRRLRGIGHSKQQACDESWSAMLAKFPPPDQSQPRSTDVEPERIEEEDNGVSIEHTADERRELLELALDPEAWNDVWDETLSWAHAYRNLDVTPTRAPSILAWLMLKLARADLQRFNDICFMEYCQRVGGSWPPGPEDEALMRFGLSIELSDVADMARLDEEDRRLGKSPTLIEAIHNAATEEEAENIHRRAVEMHATTPAGN